MNLNTMSRSELEQLRKDVDKALDQVGKRERADALAAADKAAREFGFSLSELTGSGTKTAKADKAAPKYRNPDDSSQTWSGRGRQPQWYKDAIGAGKSPEDMAI
jgi:DNA-binding protein H-NS